MADDMGQQGNDANKMSDAMGKIGSTASAIMPVLKSLFDILSSTFGTNTMNAVNKFTDQLSDVQDAFKQITSEIEKLDESQTVLFDAQEHMNEPIDKLIGSFTKLNAFVSNANFFEKMTQHGTTALNTISENVQDLQASLANIGLDPKKIGIDPQNTGIIQNAAQAEKLENAYYTLSMRAGAANDIFDKENGSLKDLSTITAAYSRTVLDSAEATGISAKQSFDFANALKTIPNILNENINTGSDLNNTSSTLTKTMQLMSGTTGDQADVINALNTAYDKLSDSGDKLSNTNNKVSTSAQKGAEFLALTSQVANTLQLRFDDVRGVMEHVADQFKFIGNETDAAGRVLARYTEALRETGLTGKASLEVIQDMIGGIKEMNVGTKAFMSLKSGGPGGLQGAFQIEQLLRQGKLDQVMQMSEKALKQQFGGKIYTQAEAAQSPEAASQFMRQRQLLQSGAFGVGKNLNDEKATRLLEALGKGDMGTASAVIKSGQEALKQATERGTSIEEHNNNELKRLNVLSQRATVAAELQAGIMMRNAFGGERVNAEMKKAGRISDMSANVLKSGTLGTTGSEAEQAQQMAELGHRAVMSAVSAQNVIGDGFKSLGDASSVIRDLINIDNGPISQFQNKMKNTVKQPINMPNSARESVMQNQAMQEQKRSTVKAEQKQQKITLEIVGPPGFGVKKSGPSAMQRANVNSAVVNLDIDNDPGY